MKSFLAILVNLIFCGWLSITEIRFPRMYDPRSSVQLSLPWGSFLERKYQTLIFELVMISIRVVLLELKRKGRDSTYEKEFEFFLSIGYILAFSSMHSSFVRNASSTRHSLLKYLLSHSQSHMYAHKF